METSLMILLLVHVIALLGFFTSARHDVVRFDADGEVY
jgi:hypothetical protein